MSKFLIFVANFFSQRGKGRTRGQRTENGSTLRSSKQNYESLGRIHRWNRGHPQEGIWPPRLAPHRREWHNEVLSQTGQIWDGESSQKEEFRSPTLHYVAKQRRGRQQNCGVLRRKCFKWNARRLEQEMPPPRLCGKCSIRGEVSRKTARFCFGRSKDAIGIYVGVLERGVATGHQGCSNNAAYGEGGSRTRKF